MTDPIAQPTMTPPRVALDDVSCAFGSLVAVDHLHLTLMRGEFVSRIWLEFDPERITLVT